jgi:SNF2 family DNA or RNA helicase
LEWIDPDKEDDLILKKKQRNLKGFVEEDSDEAGGKAKKSKKSKKKTHGLLYMMNWYRVVIDEAQIIRNKRTRMCPIA